MRSLYRKQILFTELYNSTDFKRYCILKFWNLIWFSVIKDGKLKIWTTIAFEVRFCWNLEQSIYTYGQEIWSIFLRVTDGTTKKLFIKVCNQIKLMRFRLTYNSKFNDFVSFQMVGNFQISKKGGTFLWWRPSYGK